REIELHAAVSGHPNILPYHSCYVADDHYHVVFDACKGGHLGVHVDARRRFHHRDDEIKRVFLQLVAAVRHCHSLGIAHRNLSPENFLAADYTGRTFYLANFEHATTERRCKRLHIGTKAYMSPECLGTTRWKKDYDAHASDVWSLGIILVYMVAGVLPWDQAYSTDTRYSEYVYDRSFLQSYLPLSDRLMPLLSRILEPDAKRRIGLAELERKLARVPSLTIS
ncbi:kinase-like domain-containing protein, partial [Vararia minispora EC-137]